MRPSDSYLDAARSLLACWLSSPNQTESDVGKLFSADLFKNTQLFSIASAIQSFREEKRVSEINVINIGNASDMRLCEATYMASTALGANHYLSSMLAEYGKWELASKTNGKTPRGLDDSQLARRAGDSLKRLQRGVERLRTGFSELDRALGGGIAVPSIVILGAKPKCGKSTIISTIADNVVSSGGYAYLLDLENGMDRFLRRFMCRHAHVDPEVLARDSFLPPEPWKTTERRILTEDYGRRFFVDNERRLPAASLERNIEEMAKRANGDGKQFLVVLDSLQKLPMKSLSDRRAGIDLWMRWLEQIRDTYRATILITSELKRPQQGLEYKPSEVALKESGDIEYTADLVLSLDSHAVEDEYAAEDDKPKSPATMRIVYNRDGRTGIVADYRLIHPYHEVQEIPRLRSLKQSGNVVPIR